MSVGNGYKEPNNELFFSLPDGKPPFLGILYETLELSNLPKEFVSDDPKELFLYYTGNRINIRVQLSNGTVVRFFSQLIYDRTQLLLWLDSIKDSEKIVFGLLLKKGDKQELVIHPRTQKPYYFNVQKLFLIDFKDKRVLKVIR